MLRPQGPGVHQVSVMAQRHVALHMADDDGLDVVVVLSAGGGIAHMPHRDVSVPQPFQALPVKNLPGQPVPFEMVKHAVAGNRDAAAFLPPVLQRVQPEIDFPGHRLFGR